MRTRARLSLRSIRESLHSRTTNRGTVAPRARAVNACSLGPGLDEQVFLEIDGQSGERPRHPAEVAAGHVVAHAIGPGWKAAQLHRALVALRVERVVEPV